jgi:hypothetical protein
MSSNVYGTKDVHTQVFLAKSRCKPYNHSRIYLRKKEFYYGIASTDCRTTC